MDPGDFPSLTLVEALKRLSEMPRFLNAAIATATAEELRLRAAPDSFCLIEHACHLRDLEREGYGERLRRILAEDEPELAGFEGDVIARERDYMAQDAHNAAAEFALARAALVVRAERLGAAEMRRGASLMGRRITVCDLLSMMVGHDQEHCRDIAALVRLREA